MRRQEMIVGVHGERVGAEHGRKPCEAATRADERVARRITSVCTPRLFCGVIQ